MTVRRDKTGRWRYRKVVRLEDGSRVRISGTPTINTKLECEREERAHIERTLNPTALRTEVPTFKQFSDEFMKTYAMANNKPSERTAKESMLRVHLLPAFAASKLDEITIRDVEGLKAAMLAKGRKPKSVNNCLTVLGKVLHYAAEIGIIGAAPRIKFLKVTQPEIDFLDFDELDRLFEAARSEADVYVAILGGAHAGLRSGEIRALEWQDVDVKARRLTVRQADWRGIIGTPKGRRTRRLDLTDRLRSALQAIRHLRGDFVFCHASGERWNRTVMDAMLWRVCKRAGLRRFGWHALRHTFCSHLAMNGVSAKAIQELAGHSSLATTERYMHLSPDVTQAAIRTLDNSRGKGVAKGGSDPTGDREESKG